MPEKKKRGRPRKTYDPSSQYGKNKKVDPGKEGIFRMPPNTEGSFVFVDDEPLKKFITNDLETNFDYMPLGLIMKNFEPKVVKSVNDTLSMVNFKNSKDLNRKYYYAAATTLTDEFFGLRQRYYRVTHRGMKNLAYHMIIYLDIRNYRNLSVLSQIINESAQKIFPKCLTIWRLKAPLIETDPCYELSFIVSNPSIDCSGYMSSSFYDIGLNKMSGKFHDIAQNTMNVCRSKTTKSVLLKPISFDPEFDTEHMQEKPDGVSYIKWYKDILGE